MARVKSHLALKAMADFLRDQNEFLELEVAKRTCEVMAIQDVTILAMASLAETRFSARAWEGAFAADQRLVSLLDPAERDQLLVSHHRMGRAQQELQKTRGAIASYHQALAIEPEHAPTLARLSEPTIWCGRM